MGYSVDYRKVSVTILMSILNSDSKTFIAGRGLCQTVSKYKISSFLCETHLKLRGGGDRSMYPVHLQNSSLNC